MPVIPALGRWRQEDQEFKITLAIYMEFQTSLDYMRPNHKTISHPPTQPTNQQNPARGLSENRKFWVVLDLGTTLHPSVDSPRIQILRLTYFSSFFRSS